MRFIQDVNGISVGERNLNNLQNAGEIFSITENETHLQEIIDLIITERQNRDLVTTYEEE